jgi:hypothetical protein
MCLNIKRFFSHRNSMKRHSYGAGHQRSCQGLDSDFCYEDPPPPYSFYSPDLRTRTCPFHILHKSFLLPVKWLLLRILAILQVCHIFLMAGDDREPKIEILPFKSGEAYLEAMNRWQVEDEACYHLDLRTTGNLSGCIFLDGSPAITSLQNLLGNVDPEDCLYDCPLYPAPDRDSVKAELWDLEHQADIRFAKEKEGELSRVYGWRKSTQYHIANRSQVSPLRFSLLFFSILLLICYVHFAWEVAVGPYRAGITRGQIR